MDFIIGAAFGAFILYMVLLKSEKVRKALLGKVL